jgi:hypothetical protein
MAHRKIVITTLPLILAIAALFIILPSKGQVKDSQRKSQRRAFDETRYPIADFLAGEPSEPGQRVKRRVRSEKYDQSLFRVNPNAAGDTTSIVDMVDANLPAFPLAQGSLVVVGQIMDARAYLSSDKSGVYSSFTIQLNEILKDTSKSSLTTGSVIEAERQGGRVRFPSGRLHLFLVSRLDMPQVGLRYLLFLQNGADGPIFQIISGYELKDGKVSALDDLPNAKTYENADELIFLSQVRSLASQP